MSINETVLEMHFHRELMNLFRSTFGVGAAGKISFYKYSPQKECFVGFDQAWVMTDVSDDALYADLKEAATNGGYALKNKYVGYFLQYKVVKRMVLHKTKNFPSGLSKPFGRVSISTQANETSGKSQHELLFELAKNQGALAYYACPAIFEKAELYAATADLDKLHLVDISSCPDPFKDHQRHYVYFDLPLMNPTWCSEPTMGNAIKASELGQLLHQRLAESPQNEAERLRELIDRTRSVSRQRAADLEAGNSSDPVLQALTILKLSQEKTDHDSKVHASAS